MNPRRHPFGPFKRNSRRNSKSVLRDVFCAVEEVDWSVLREAGFFSRSSPVAVGQVHRWVGLRACLTEYAKLVLSNKVFKAVVREKESQLTGDKWPELALLEAEVEVAELLQTFKKEHQARKITLKRFAVSVEVLLGRDGQANDGDLDSAGAAGCCRRVHVAGCVARIGETGRGRGPQAMCSTTNVAWVGNCLRPMSDVPFRPLLCALPVSTSRKHTEADCERPRALTLLNPWPPSLAPSLTLLTGMPYHN